MQERKILVVDDNPQYRSAVTRNLSLAGYNVIEAENSAEGMEKVQTESPQVVITDLDMRTHDEGLNFIREVKRSLPKLPMIMISAVGTFDEGALARQYGAIFVLSKSRIDAEINTLYERLDSIYQHLEHLQLLSDRVEEAIQNENISHDTLRQELNQLLQNQDLDSGFKSEAYDLLDRLERHENQAAQMEVGVQEQAIVQSLRNDLPEIDLLDKETRTMLAIAENMQQSPSSSTLSIARNISFSYSFAVENEVKLRIGRKVGRLLSSAQMKDLTQQLYDPALNNLDIFFNQYLIRLIQQKDLELNSDITRQVLERILKHGPKYKPDGLKALGVILFCWGRNHNFTNRKGKVTIQNPLSIKGLDDDRITDLASQLIELQHLRNPFIHPEFNEWEKTESLRHTALACLSNISQAV